jgi:lipopolysaccharide export system protein LptA
VRWSLIVAACVVFVFASAASAQPVPTTIDADVITYDSLQQIVTAQGNVRTTFRQYRLFADAAQFDLRTGVVAATGRVRLVGLQGQELRGRALTYNTRTEAGVLESVEGVVERRVYLRGDRLEVSPDRFVAHDSMVTTCDPARPLYRIVARRVEIIPNQEIVAHDASVYLGTRRLFTVMRYAVSLRPGEAGTNLPGFGSNTVDGFWIDYRLPVRVSSATGRLYLKYGAQSGVMALLSLTHRAPAFTTTLRLGRTQTTDERQAFTLLRYDVAEISVASRPVPVGQTPFSWNLSAAAGWFQEQLSGVATTRLDAEVGVTSRPIPVGPRLVFTTGATLRVSSYGTGAVRTITSLNASLGYELDRYTTMTLGYQLVTIRGSTPLAIDVVDPASTVSLAVLRAVPGRYRIAASAAHNTALSETKYSAAVGAFVTPTLELGVSALYNTRLAAFEDIDYMLRRICDCIDVVIRYRQVRREFSIELGLVGFPERGAPFVPRAIPQPPALQPP